MHSYRQVQGFPKDLHWFCPRDDEDQGNFFPEDLEDAAETKGEDDPATKRRAKRVKEARTRKTLALDALQIFAFDGPDAAQHQRWLEEHLAEQLGQCSICVREFHRGRWDLKEKLEE